MITLGIDPGTAILGYGVVVGDDQPGVVTYGVLRTASDLPMPERLVQLYDGVRAIIAEYRPEVLAIEQLLFGRNVTTAIAVGQARGVVLPDSEAHTKRSPRSNTLNIALGCVATTIPRSK